MPTPTPTPTATSLTIQNYVIAGGGGTSVGGTLQLTGVTAQPAAALSNGGLLSLMGGFFFDGALYASTPAGPNVIVAVNGNSQCTSSFCPSTVAFAGVSAPGTTAITPIDPGAQGTPPSGYTITGTAFDISTTATYTAPVTVCFNMSSVTDPNAFGNLRILHDENGTLVDRTSSLDFSNKTVCATTSTLSPFVIASLTTPRDIKQSVLNQLIALRVKITDKDDGHELNDAIKALSDSLDPSLWIDGLHLQAGTGDKDFDDEKQTVIKLRDLMNDKRAVTYDAELAGLIERIKSADRLLAQIAINDALAAHDQAEQISQAESELAEGNKDAVSGKPEAIDDYREAWKHSINAMRQP